MGSLSDRVGRKRTMALGLVLQIAAFLLFLAAQGLGLLYLGAAAFGFFYGGVATLFPALVGDFFGRRHAGTIAGFLFASSGILGAWGPIVAGYLRDITGNYQLVFTLSALTSVCALLLFLVTSRPPKYAGR